ncbi:putative DNA-binding protein (UPF0251 family) [Dokdonella fugitiva]|uniref:Putative DNA-binding protein (UPF0251 family) n=1 Tax=Dokdonella fugitiva TaxID=328517 RepID=A0A839F511_9GAMM|nr:helix-turn-helix domain-containing protein [Dokdonella fugitiva]MBA8888899.1 putative DNA-binding protein (UPF0251 family) [Dokdonella fugitiva]
MKRIIGRQCKTKPRQQATPAVEPTAAPERIMLPSGFEAIIERPRFHPNALGEISQAEAARYLGISERTLRDHIRDGLAHPPFKQRAGRRWFNLDALHAWAIAEGTENNGKGRKFAEAA